MTAVDIPPAESPARPHPGDVPDHLVVAPGVSPVVGELPAHTRGAPGGPGGGEVDYCGCGHCGHVDDCWLSLL